MRIAVLGGGNGSFAAAGDIALAGHDVRLWRRDVEAVKAHNAAGGTITVKDFRGRHEAKLSLMTNDIAEAVRDAELILCPAPATAQPDIARALAPHLADGQVVFLPPGTFGSYIFAKAQRDAGNRADAAFAETGTLPWLTRKHGPHRGRDHDPRQAAADRRAAAAPEGSRARRHRPRVPRRDRGLRRCAVRRADECRADHPSAADHHERRAARTFSALGHPQGGHAAFRAPRHRCARRGTHRGARGARLRRAAFSACAIITRARARNGCTAAARTTSSPIRATGASTSC